MILKQLSLGIQKSLKLKLKDKYNDDIKKKTKTHQSNKTRPLTGCHSFMIRSIMLYTEINLTGFKMTVSLETHQKYALSKYYFRAEKYVMY